MEFAWIMGGFVLGYVVGTMFETFRTKSAPEPKTFAPRAEDEELYRMEWSDRLERLDKMIDRVRVRARVAQDKPAAAGDRETPLPSPKSRLRALARERGLLIGGFNSVSSDER